MIIFPLSPPPKPPPSRGRNQLFEIPSRIQICNLNPTFYIVDLPLSTSVRGIKGGGIQHYYPDKLMGSSCKPQIKFGAGSEPAWVSLHRHYPNVETHCNASLQRYCSAYNAVLYVNLFKTFTIRCYHNKFDNSTAIESPLS